MKLTLLHNTQTYSYSADLARHDFSQKERQPITKGLAKYGQTEVIFGICNSVVLWFGAGHLLFSFLLLSSTKVFQSAFVPGLTSIYSRTSPSLDRCASL